MWSTDLAKAVAERWGTTVENQLRQMLSDDGGQGEVLASYPSYAKLRKAMLKWHSACDKTVFGYSARTTNSKLVELARNTFRQRNRKPKDRRGGHQMA